MNIIKGSLSYTHKGCNLHFSTRHIYSIFWWNTTRPHHSFSHAFCYFLNALLKMHFCTLWKHPQWLKHSAWQKKCIASAKLFDSVGWFGSIAKLHATCELWLCVCAYNKTLNCSINFMKLFVSAHPIFIPYNSHVCLVSVRIWVCCVYNTWKFICRNPVYIVLHLLVSRYSLFSHVCVVQYVASNQPQYKT